MEYERIIEQLESNVRRLHALVAGVSTSQAIWRPEPSSWSILEVICHLYDEEREDFRVRFDLLLHNTNKPWPPIDPAGWVTARRYNECDIEVTVENFLQERQKSVDWLRSLDAPDMEACAEAPWGGRITAGDIIAAWVAHDTLHMRQLVELHHAFIIQLTIPYSTEYAGQW